MAPWQDIVKQKRDSLFKAIPPKWRLDPVPSADDEPDAVAYINKIVPSSEKQITDLTLLQLQSRIQKGELKALDVTTAFSRRAVLLHQLTNCCSEIFLGLAFEQAKKQDAYFEETNGKTVGPLHGIPLSLKDQFNLESIDSAMGFVSLLNKPIPKEKESKLALILRDQLGAIFFIKTTTPPAMMAFATMSNICGETVNAYNRHVSCGGSSGGEGVIVAGRGAVLGWGTDIGGSIRVPSGFAGIYGLKGSTARLPYCNMTNSFENQPVLQSVVGPMAQDLEDLKYVTKLVIEAQPWLLDPKVPPIEWRLNVDLTKRHADGKLTFAVMRWNGQVHTSPPVSRAIDTVVKALKAQGHEVLEWKPPVSNLDLASIAIGVYGPDGYQEVVDYTEASGEPFIPEILSLQDAKEGSRGKDGAALPPECEKIQNHWAQAGDRYHAQQAVDSYWFMETGKATRDGKPVDGVIAPVWDTPSFVTEDVVKFNGDYTSLFNTLDYSVVVVPVTKSDKNVDKWKEDEKFVPVTDKDQEIHDYYDAELMDNVPVGVQVVAPRWQEEIAIELAVIVDGALKKKD